MWHRATVIGSRRVLGRSEGMVAKGLAFDLHTLAVQWCSDWNYRCLPPERQSVLAPCHCTYMETRGGVFMDYVLSFLYGLCGGKGRPR